MLAQDFVTGYDHLSHLTYDNISLNHGTEKMLNKNGYILCYIYFFMLFICWCIDHKNGYKRFVPFVAVTSFPSPACCLLSLLAELVTLGKLTTATQHDNVPSKWKQNSWVLRNWNWRKSRYDDDEWCHVPAYDGSFRYAKYSVLQQWFRTFSTMRTLSYFWALFIEKIRNDKKKL